MAKVLGYWKLERNENFDDYMKAEGVNFALRKVGNNITSYEEIIQDGDNWELKITSTFKNAHLKFKLGEEFDETTMDGRHVKSTFTVEGDKLVHIQKTPNSTSRLEREVKDDYLILTCHQIDKDVTARRIFKRCQK